MALEYAVRLANEQDQGLVVCFGLMPNYPESNRRHFAFMLEGLAETAESLHERGIKFVTQIDEPGQVSLTFARQASVVVCDCGYLRHQRQWRRQVAAEADKQVIQIEGDTVVPVETVSDKREYEELIVRRELAINFVYFEPDYDSHNCLPGWAQETLEAHGDDPRPYRYTQDQTEHAETHDAAWSVAMTEMRITGYMHNYMRMY